MAGQLAAKLLERGFTFHVPMGEDAGDCIDAIGENDGSVTIGVGARGVAALNDGGDGCITFDNADTRVEVPADAAVDNVWTGGGTGFFIWRANTTGENLFGMIFSKSDGVGANELVAREASGNFYKMGHTVEHTGGNNGWRTSDEPFEFGDICMMVLTLDWDAGTNDPVWYTWNGVLQQTRTIGNGLLERNDSNAGTPVSDAGSSLMLGNRHELDQNWDGEIDEVAFAAGVTLTEAQAYELIDLALAEIGGSPEGQLAGVGQMAGATPAAIRHTMVGT